MKLRNKETGEIPDKIETLTYIQWSKKLMMVYIDKKGQRIMKCYDSMGAFRAEWEDVDDNDVTKSEEPKSVIKNVWFNSVIADAHIVEIDFINDDEAIKAVEKLKAWKRLRDKGFRFDRYSAGCGINTIYFSHRDGEFDLRKDLDLLFGGEE